MTLRQVRPKRLQTKARVSASIAAAWARVAAGQKGAFADAIEINTKTVDRAMTGETLPELHTAFNALTFDPTALDEVAALYGVKIVPLYQQAANDLETAAGVLDAMGELVSSHADGRRDHNETLTVARKLRPHLPALTNIILEADELKAGRA